MRCAVMYDPSSKTIRTQAEAIARRFAADLIPVLPEIPGTAAPSASQIFSAQILRKANKAAAQTTDFQCYDVVFIGFHVLRGTMPACLQEYLTRCNLKDVFVIPFVNGIVTGKEQSLNGVRLLAGDARLQTDLYYYTDLFRKPGFNAWLDQIEQKFR